MDALGILAARFHWPPSVLMELTWDEIDTWLDLAEWTGKLASGEAVER